jgi:hypothetical protein
MLRHTRVFAFVVLAACRTNAGPTPSASSAPPPPSAVPTAPTASVSAAPTRRPFAVRNLGGGAVEVRNDGDVPVRVAFELDIEREVGGRWESTHVSNMLAQTKCFDPRPADVCVTIPAHGAFRPLPWRGWFGCTQCLICRANVPASPGRYRIVAIGCAGGDRVESEPTVVVREGVIEGAAGE